MPYIIQLLSHHSGYVFCYNNNDPDSIHQSLTDVLVGCEISALAIRSTTFVSRHRDVKHLVLSVLFGQVLSGDCNLVALVPPLYLES